MGLPQISIQFNTAGITAIKRAERGIVALVLKDGGIGSGLYNLYSVADKPVGLSASNNEQIDLAFIGGISVPKKVIVYVMPTTATGYSSAFSVLETVKFDYLAIPDIISGQELAIVSWVKTMRDSLKRKIKIVMPKQNADYEGVINFTTDNIKVGSKTYTTAQYCSRIAGLLAGTPLQISATYYPLSEVDDVARLTEEQINTAIDNGEFIIFHDGEKVKVGRAINSLKTISATKSVDWKKIKIIDILDQIFTDIKNVAEDNYIGKYPNSYDNKILLISAINGYLKLLEKDNILDENKNSVGIDVVSQTAYLLSIGTDVSALNEQEIKEANTKDQVFLSGVIKPLDAIEDITLALTI